MRPELERLRGRLAVLSPHLDDAAFSLGATIAKSARAGARVTIATVFAGDPASRKPAGDWDRRAGFRSASDAARARREEDRRACSILGADPVWLDFEDEQHAQERDADAVWAALEAVLAEAEAVLVPGFPLLNPDHAWLTPLVLDRFARPERTGLYVEQPYATWYRGDEARPELMRTSALLGGAAPSWLSFRPGLHDWLAKQRALRAFRSQLAVMARPLQRVPLAVALYEARRGGETLAWIDQAGPMPKSIIDAE